MKKSPVVEIPSVDNKNDLTIDSVRSDLEDTLDLWNTISKFIKELVSGDAYHRWFETANLVSVNETEAVLAVESDMHQVWIETNYLPEVQTAFSRATELPCKVKVVVDSLLSEQNAVSNITDTDQDGIESEEDDEQVDTPLFAGADFSEENSASKKGAGAIKSEMNQKLKSAGLNPQFSFTRFVVGQNNEFAHAACTAVASANQAVYNPLFIHGDSGLGKTHLMQAIGQQLVESNPSAKVVYLTYQ